MIPSGLARSVTFLWTTLSIAITASAVEPVADWGEKNYFLEQQSGLEQNAITAVKQSRDGYIWLGTYTGLLRFDGVRFTVFNSSNSRGLRNGRITKLFEDDFGTLWIGHETGELTEFKNGVFKPVEFKPSRPDTTLEDITMDARGNVWVLNGNGSLYRLSDGLLLGERLPKSKPISLVLSRDDHGQLWLAFNGAISTVQNDQLVPFRFDDGDQTNFYSTIFPSHDGGLWTMRNGVLRKWRDGKWVADLGAPWGPDAPLALAETRNGTLITGTLKGGLFLLRPNFEPIQFNRANGLSHDWVRSLCEDREGNIWIGTGGGGLNVLRERRAKLLNAPDGWMGRSVLATVIHQNDAWLGTEGSGLYHYDLEKKTWRNFGDADGLTNSFIWSVCQSRQGELFVGTWDGGIFAKRGERFERLESLAKITSPVTAFYEDRDGALWIGTGTGLHKFEGGKLVYFAGAEKLFQPDVRAITQSPDGTIWFGMSGGGLARFNGGTLQQFQKRDGLGSDFAQALFAETNNTIWIGTSDNGVCRLQDGKFTIINTDAGFPDNVIVSMADDGLGHFWFGTHHGISRISKAELEKRANALSRRGDEAEVSGQMRAEIRLLTSSATILKQALPSTVHPLTFDSSDGLPSEICSGGFQPSFAKGPGNSIWIPTAKGVVMVEPAKVKKNYWPPTVVIEKLIVEGQPVGSKTEYVIGSSETQKPIQISPGNQRLEVHYNGLSFTAPGKVRFKYKLAKLEREWVDAGKNRSVQFSYLPPGNYKFHVIACNNDGLWNETGATLSFTLLPYFWQTLWFRIVVSAAAAALIGFSVLWLTRRRLRQKVELLERQRAIERERTRIARDIHDEVGASLTRITMLSESLRGENPDRAAENAEQVYRTARETTRALDEIVWAVDPKHDTLDSLASYLGRYAQSFLKAAHLRCRLDVPLNLPAWGLTAEIRHNVFLAFKEALNNVAKHAAATEVQIAMVLLSDKVFLSVVDNGRGFKLEKTNGGTVKAVSENGSTGNGISNMQKRLEEIGGACEWEVTGKGTAVKIQVLLQRESGGSQN